ncbi:TolB family protein [Streptomyces sp. URMC 126]|uniref:TolB family protein n=1 Tax=Streptomyces sp. URMC 126 TaxID=3423401 RepID=UPI003F1D801F
MGTKRRTTLTLLPAAALALALTATAPAEAAGAPAAGAAARPHWPVVVPVGTAADGTPANADVSAPAISGDGRYVAFSTKADNLVPGDTEGLEDVFVKDVRTGRITRIAAPERGPDILGARAVEPSLSADGRRLAFRSYVTQNNHTKPPSHFSHIHVVDLRTGRREQADVDLAAPDGGSSRNPLLAPDGRSVTFTSGAGLSSRGDYIHAARLWRRDLVRHRSTLLAAPAEAAVERATFSRDGRRLVYEDLRGGVSGRWTSRVHVRDMRTGADRRLDVPYDGSPDQQYAQDPSVSPDGRYAQFTARAYNLLPGGIPGAAYVYLSDLRRGTLQRITAKDDEPSAEGEFAAGGRLLTFNGGGQVYLRDLRTGRTRLISATPDGTPGDGASGAPAPDARGDAIAFRSTARDLVPGADGTRTQVYLRMPD